MSVLEPPGRATATGGGSPTEAHLGGGRRLRSGAWRIAAAYGMFAAVWILFSDRALAVVVTDPELLLRYGSYKGLAFVTVTAVLLWLLIRRSLGRAADAYSILEANEGERIRLGRLYAALTAINQAIVRRPARDRLLEQACRALVEEGGFAMAWVGWHDTERRLLVPVSSCGDDGGYLDDVTVHTDDRPEGWGPSGMAIREERPHICNDMLADPSMSAWQEAVARHGFRATASFPLLLGGETRGLLNVYAEEVGYFEQAEIDLLTEAAADISYALDNLVHEEERQRAEATAREERIFSETMIDSMPGILYFYDAAGRFLRWNRNFETVSGYSRQEIAGMHPLDFFAGDDREKVEERISAAFTWGEASVEAAFVDREGRGTPYFLTGRRVEFAGRACLVGVGIDITERERAESALRDLNDHLELEVGKRTDELQAALIRAEAADQLKSSFLATMSHELRTPLNSIIGFTGIVIQGLAGPLTEEQAKQLGMVRGSARHLLALINDVLDLSKIEAGQLQMSAEPFDLGAAIDRVARTVQPLVDDAGLMFETQVDPALETMVGDQRRLEQILLNLLSNAVKFSDAGSVRLRADRLAFAFGDREAPAPAVRLTVRDTGIGISPADLESLFQPFRQIDSGLTRQHDGTGLGLAICRRLATLMGGRITATSEPAVGSEFTVTLPLDDRSPS